MLATSSKKKSNLMFTEDQQGGRQDKMHFEERKTPRPGSCQEDFSLKVGN